MTPSAAPGAGTDQHDLADEIAVDRDAVQHAVDLGDGAVASAPWSDGRAARCRSRCCKATPSSLMLVAKLLGRLDVGRGDRGDALERDRSRCEISVPKARLVEDGELVRGVVAVDVEGRIGLGIAERAGRRRARPRRAGPHSCMRGEDVVAGAVEDAEDARRPDCRRGSRASVFTIGMPPATAASKFSASDLASARRASAAPCIASSALLAVTTCLPARERRLDGRLRRAFRAADQLDEHIDGSAARELRRDRRTIRCRKDRCRDPCRGIARGRP